MSAPAPARRGPVAGQMKPTELMQACGSKSGQWQPESPDHWRWQLKNGEGPERALAWVKLNSIGRASPYCVNVAGECLTVAHLAADCEWKLQTAKNFCSVLAAEGRIRLQRGERIWYRADVPDQKAEDAKYSVQSIFPDYLTDFIENLPEAKRATLEEYRTWRKKFFADGMASLRRIDEQVQDSTLLSVGVNKKRLPKRTAFDPKCVQLSLIEAPSFVEYSVQSNGAYKAENGSVRSTPPPPIIIGFNSSLATTLKSVSQSVERPTDRLTDPIYSEAKAAALKTLLVEEYGRRFPGETPSSRLCVSILAALEGAPLELLQIQIRQRMKSSTSMGFALKLAEDVAQRWREDALAREKAEAGRAEREERERVANAVEFADIAERVMDDPNAPEEDKTWARELLKTAAKAKAAGGAA